MLKESVPEVKSKFVEPPVKEMLVEAMVVVAPLINTFPPKVNKPLPVVTGRFVTVLRNNVEPVVKSIIGFVPVKFIFEASVVVFVTVRLLMVVVAKEEMPFTVSVELKVAAPFAVNTVKVVEARLDVPLTVSWTMVVVAKVDVAATDNCPSRVSLPVSRAEPITENATPGVVVPIPTFPALVTRRKETPEDEATSNTSVPPWPTTDKVINGVEVFIPTRRF